MARKLSLAGLRRDYKNSPLLEWNAPADPLVLFGRWFRQALRSRVLDANAFTLATATPSGRPATRTVLLKGYDEKGFVFFTNYKSRKGGELGTRPFASFLFYWPQLMRQVRLDGRIRKVSRLESDEYFRTRPYASQLSAWASPQSRILPGRKILEGRMKAVEEKYRGKDVPRPPHWGGYRLVPSSIEFWKGRPSRLHDRLFYRKKGKRWTRVRLSP
jgi:pyridoxamine 5'-phosphate oxidase